jgi:hypothetical protein
MRGIRRKYLHLQNVHFLFGGLTSAGLHVLENGLAAWDADSGIPSRLNPAQPDILEASHVLQRRCWRRLREGKGEPVCC